MMLSIVPSRRSMSTSCPKASPRTAPICLVDPFTWAFVARNGLTAVNSGTSARASANAGGRPWNPLLLTKKSAVTEVLNWSVKDFFTDSATTETVLTSARPTIRAEAVEAVRLGVRWAFRLANRPGTVRVIGRNGTGSTLLMALLIGAATVVERLAIPRNRRIAPRPELDRVPAAPPGWMKSPTASNVRPAARVDVPTTRRLFRCRAEKPSSGRIAATGGMRPARTAGTAAAATPPARRRAQPDAGRMRGTR